MRREKSKASKEDENEGDVRTKHERRGRTREESLREEEDEAEVSGEVVRQGEDEGREDRVGPVTRGERTIM